MTITDDTRTDYAAARKAMIDSQLRTSGVNEAFVLARMSVVPREKFVPDSARGFAYMDRAVRLGDGAFLPAPVFHGAMLAAARPVADDRVLVIDAGSGYLTELVRPMVQSVDTVTPQDGAAGQAQAGDYTLILVDGAIEEVPQALADLLSEEGRIVTGIVSRGVTRLAAGRHSGRSLALLPLAEMGIPRLSAFDRPTRWEF